MLKDVVHPTKEATADYRTFCRDLGIKEKCSVNLSQKYKTNKTDLFNIWRRNGKNWGRTHTAVERMMANTTQATGKKSLVQVRDLVKRGMPQHKAEGNFDESGRVLLLSVIP